MLGRREAFHDKVIQWISKSEWNHAGLIVDEKGTVIEMYQGGIQKSQVDKEREDQILIVRLPLNKRMRSAIKEYAAAMMNNKVKFGYLSLFSMALNKLTGWPVIIKMNGTMVCSEFVANALTRGGIIWQQDTSLITPADLYNQFIK